MEKSSFLLDRAQDVSSVIQENWVYDECLQLNTIESDKGMNVPVCSLSSMVTCSKTEAAPGDDDPDSDAEKCY